MMKRLPVIVAIKNIAYLLGFAGASLVFSSQVGAQQVYRIVGPDGRVSFSDKPPPPSDNAKVSTGRAGSFTETGSGTTLPFELRTVVQRYPVTLYTSKDCPPCDAGRNLLRSRGVPFTERTIESTEDAEAFRRLAGDGSLPMATVGSQQMKGFSDAEWSQFLDAAAYPKTSVLPSGYRNPAPAPMVARTAPAAAPAAAAPTPAPVAPAADTGPTPSNPAGIRF
jgi:glutaredoxin